MTEPAIDTTRETAPDTAAEVTIVADRQIRIDGAVAYNPGDPVPYEAALALNVPLPEGYVPPVDAPPVPEPEPPAVRLVRMTSPGSVTAAGSRRHYVFDGDPVEMDEVDAVEVLTDYPDLFVEVDADGNDLPRPGDERAYTSMLKADLVELCEARGLDASGTKAELVERLVADDEALAAAAAGEDQA
jgi:hypothetical protein